MAKTLEQIGKGILDECRGLIVNGVYPGNPDTPTIEEVEKIPYTSIKSVIQGIKQFARNYVGGYFGR